ncbi:MAG: sugar phosphate isomerase/epimerase [Anaerolineae bacterium]|nr:sugar phosphate isomerase/epimerase [Anaerolineae bacterium]
MPKFGSHAYLWIDEWTPEKGNYAIAATAKTGFDLIEMPLLKPQEFDAAAHKKALAEAGIEGTTTLVLPDDCHLPFYPQKARQFLLGALEKVEAVGSTFLGGCIAYSLGVFTNKPPTAAERQAVVDVMGEVALDAKKRGITLGFETVNRYESYLYNSLADGRATIKAIGADNIVLHPDTYQMNIEEEGFYQPLVDCADVLGYIHISESHRGLVGSGTIIWDDVFRGLADAKFKGPLVLESFVAINPDLMAATKLWRPPNQPSEVLASEGLKFMRAKAEQFGLI